MQILVTGGAGYIGSHTVLALLEAGYDVLIADSFVNSKPQVLDRLHELACRPFLFERCDLCDAEAAERLFSTHEIGAVIHFAGLKAVGESVEQPLRYYENNLTCTLNILHSMRRHGVTRFVFSSSATVYGDPASVPIREDFPRTATNPYGWTKYMIEQILRENPGVRVTYGVRGGPVINDVTLDDAEQVGMADVARVLSSGVATPTTVLSASTEEFRRAFYDADLVISKGMGNFEVLVDGCGREDVYFLLMTKCGHVASLVDAPLMSFVCKRG